MAQITQPNQNYVPIASDLGVNSGAAVGDSAAGIGAGLLQGSASILSMAQQQAAASEQYFKEAQASINTSMYTSALNKATVQFGQAIKDRAAKQVDENGNPTFAQLPSDVGTMGQQIANDAMKNLGGSEAAKMFNEHFNNIIASKQVDAMTTARQQQQSYMQSQDLQSYHTQSNEAISGSVNDSLMARQQYYTQVDNQVKAGGLTFEEAEKKKLEFNKTVNENRGLSLATNDPFGMMQATTPGSDSTYLQDNGLGDMDEVTKMKLHRESAAMVQKANQIQLATVNARIESMKSTFTDANSIIERGGQVPASTIQQLQQGATGIPQLVQQVQDLQDKQAKVSLFTSLPATAQQAAINAMKSTGQLDDQVQMYSRIKDNMEESMKKDLYSFAVTQKVAPTTPPLDITQDLAPQLANRRQAISMIQGAYNKPSSGVSDEEMSAVNDLANHLQPADKARLVGQIVSGLGPSAGTFFTQMAKSGNRDLALVGTMVLNGRNDIASNILAGQEYLKNKNLDIGPEGKKNLDYAATQVMPPMDNPDYRSDVAKLTEALYAQRSVQANDYSLNVNLDRYKQAMTDVLGGPSVKVAIGTSNFIGGVIGRAFGSGTSEIVLPTKNMTTDQFTTWYKGINATDIQELGGIQGAKTDADAVNLIKNAQLSQYGPGIYSVMVPSKAGDGIMTPAINATTGQPFRINYNRINTNRLSPEIDNQQLNNIQPESMTTGDNNSNNSTLNKSSPFNDIVSFLTSSSGGKMGVNTVNKRDLPSPTILPQDIENHVQSAADKYNVDPDLIKAIMHQESRNKPNAVNADSGATGIMQIMPATAKGLGVDPSQLKDPQVNIEAGAKLIAELMKRYNGNIKQVLSAYNASPSAVAKAGGGIPDNAETKAYVPAVLKYYNGLKVRKGGK